MAKVRIGRTDHVVSGPVHAAWRLREEMVASLEDLLVDLRDQMAQLEAEVARLKRTKRKKRKE